MRHGKVHRFVPSALLALLLLPAGAWLAYAEDDSLHVGPLTLVSTARYSRTQFDFTYRIQVVNSGGARAQAAAYVTSTSPHTIILDNEVLIGDVAAGSTITPSDTFVLRHDRSFAFDASALNWSIESEPANGAPTADAGSDVTVLVGDEVTLDGSESTDPDGNPLTYRWQLRVRPAGSSASLDDASAVRPRFQVDRAGTYLIDLVVSDGQVDSSVDTVQISTRNSAPIANAGPDRTVARGALVSLDGSLSSDPDGDALNFDWVLTQRPEGSAAALTNAQTSTPQLQIDRPGTYVAQLVVSDSVLASSPDTVRISTENSVPVADAGSNITAFVGDLVTLDGSASTDADDDALSFLWTLTSRPAGSSAGLSGPNTPSASLLADAAGLYVVQLIVNDGFGDSVPDTATVTVEVRLPPTDRDGDGLSDAREATLGTNPDDADSDDDGLSDGDEVDVHQTNPNARDTDGDGFDDDDELRAGSDPKAAGSIPSQGPPPDPSEVAPPNPDGQTTTVFESTAFLYTGPNPIQTGVASGTIVPTRAAVVRGRVLDRSNAPIAGVAITVKGHPELGRTLSRDDGGFDLAVNGGGVLTLDYEHAEYLPAQRQIDSPWQDYIFAPNVVLIGLDSVVTTIAANAPAMQTARGSVSSDADGSRQSTLLVPASTGASMVLPDGTTQLLTSLRVRATEYTVGPNGPEAMPGPLPPTSGYTYAVELSADEAIAARATRVTFTQPLFHYVENFLNFPVGSIVPSGYYDRARATWVPSDNGRVIRITAISNGLAIVDTVGTRNLPAISLSEDERRELARLYAVGQQLWRVPIAHFTPWDHNWTYGLPNGARGPRTRKAGDNDPDDDCEEDGSIIQCLGQTLGEVLPITGSSHFLRYSSSRVPGRTAAYTLDIPLSTSEALPVVLNRIVVQVSVAGRQFFRTFAPAQNLVHRFTWDGKDAYGREVHGGAIASIRVGYVYTAVYLEPGTSAQSFGAPSGVPITANRGRQEFTIWQDDEAVIGTLVEGEIGGWSLSPHHVYAPHSKTLFKGDGGRRSASLAVDSVRTIAGRGDAAFVTAGMLASQVRFRGLRTMIGGPDGSLYVIDERQIWRIDPSGITHLIAGTGAAGFGGDGGPAALATFSDPRSIALGLDGSVYVADALDSRIRRVTPGGIITTVAGNGVQGFSGDDVLATQTSLNQPQGVAIAPDGSLYIADRQNQRVRRVDPQGIITTFAGVGSFTNFGVSGPATAAGLIPDAVTVGPDGSVYVTVARTFFTSPAVMRITSDGLINFFVGGGNFGLGDGTQAALTIFTGTAETVAFGPDGSAYVPNHVNQRIVRITPDGISQTLGGAAFFAGCQAGCDPRFKNEGGPANAAGLGIAPGGVVAGPRGDIFYIDREANQIRRIAPALPGLSFTDMIIPSSDGRQVYAFGHTGRHVRTSDALTLATRFEFGYDAAGRLTTVTDGDSNVTRIERDAAGHPTAIVAPGGQRTTVAVDEDGYLASATNPAGETVRFSYKDGGLLETRTDAKNNVHRFSYDAAGRLIRDEDPSGGVTTLTRTENQNGFEITRSTVLGRVASYSVERLSNGDRRRVNSDRAGARTTVSTARDGRVTVTSPDGTITTMRPGADPRFGMLVPIAAEITHRAPSGRTLQQTMQRTVTFDANNPQILQEQLDTLVVNGRTFTERYNATSRTRTTKTPRGWDTAITYDAQGRVMSKLLAQGLDPITVDYDERGRLRAMGQGEHSQTFQYDSAHRVESRTNAEGEQTRFEYDAADRIQSLAAPGGGIFRFGYDANGNQEEIELPGGAVHRFTYTPIDREAAHILPGGGSYTRSYDVDRALTLFELPAGREVATQFDSAGRHTGFVYPEGSVTVGYATGDLTSRATRITRNPVALGSAQELQFTYDGQLPTRATWTGVAQGVFTYSYDGNFQLSAMRLVSGSDDVQTALVRDVDGLVTTYGPFTLTRDGPGGALSQIADVSSARTFSYDTMGRLTNRTLRVGSAGAPPVYATQLAYDRAGRIVGNVESLAGIVQSLEYAYDDDGRLTEVKREGLVIERYAYDANDNRLSRQLMGGSVESASYDAQDRLLQQGGVAYEFDNDGFLSRRGSDTFVYSARGELLRATVGSEVATYSYDGMGRRVGRTTSAGTTQYLYGDPGNAFLLTAVRGVDGALTTLFYDDAGLLFALQRGGARFHVATDQVGTPRRVTDASGQVVKALEFDSFGGLISDSHPAFDLPIGFGGGIDDAHSRLVRFGFRDYDPVAGRWAARDPAGFEAGQGNLFAYVGNDPINRRDPLGLFCVGASAYLGLGAGAEICCDTSGCSVCAEFGIGIGGGFEGGGGSPDKTGAKILAEASAECGPIGGTVGVSLDDDGCVDTELKGKLGPLEIDKDLDISVSGGGSEVSIGTKCAAEAKVALEFCVSL